VGGDRAVGRGSQDERDSIAAIRRAMALDDPPQPASLYLHQMRLVPDQADRSALPKMIGDPANLRREVDDSLRRLNVERIGKGIGELGICGAGASLANAIYDACGARIRDYPITPDKVLASLPVQT
jgi:hypothetical protein